MANKAFCVIIDMEFPDDMADPENPFPGGNRVASPSGEIFKVIRDGCTSQGFDLLQIRSNSFFAKYDVGLVYHLEEQ